MAGLILFIMRVQIADDKKLEVYCTFQEKEVVKSIGNYRFNRLKKCWEFPLSSLISIIDNLNIKTDKEVLALYDNLKEEQKENQKCMFKADRIKQGMDKSILSKWEGCFHHQKQALAIATLFNSYALFMETGTGKTLVAIRLIQHRKVPTMVIAPLSILESVWVKEIEKWSNLTKVILWQNLKAFNDEYDVYLINYEHFKKMKYIDEKIKFLIIDESSKLKSNKSQITKKILSYKNSIQYKTILSGKPAPNNLLEYWAQMNFINPELLTDNFYKYRSKYFYSFGYGGYQYLPFPEAKKTIMNQISKQAFFIKKEDCIDLPERIFETRIIEMDTTQERIYKEMKQENITAYKDHITLGANELAKIMKLRQITAGFTITTEHIPVKISERKVKELMNVLDELDTSRQAIIWVQFHYEIEMIKRIFSVSNIKTTDYALLYGKMPQKEKELSIQKFKEGEVKYLIAHPKSGGMGLNLAQCSYCIWFSISYSDEEFSQANDRIYRIGQINKCTYILLLAKDSIDEVIYKALQKKENMSEACLAMLKGK